MSKNRALLAVGVILAASILAFGVFKVLTRQKRIDSTLCPHITIYVDAQLENELTFLTTTGETAAWGTLGIAGKSYPAVFLDTVRAPGLIVVVYKGEKQAFKLASCPAANSLGVSTMRSQKYTLGRLWLEFPLISEEIEGELR